MNISHTAYPPINRNDRDMNEGFMKFLLKHRNRVKNEATQKYDKDYTKTN